MTHNNMHSAKTAIVKKALQKALLCTSFIAVGIASYVYGTLSSVDFSQEQLRIETPSVQQALSTVPSEDVQQGSDNKKCPFVGSINGTKYYTPQCSGIGHIDPNNLRCFADEREAMQQGYTLSKTCK